MNNQLRGQMASKNDLRGQYHFKPLILKLKSMKKTNEEIADLLDMSRSTVKYIVKNGEMKSINNKIDDMIGIDNQEFLRESSVYSCMELFSKKGWQIGVSDSKCVYDVFCVSDCRSVTVRIQVRSSSKFSKRNYPSFKTNRMLFNTKRYKRVNFNKGDFDFWYFYSINGDKWLIPFELISQKSEVSMEGFDEYKV